jgi:hypothetical protein
MTEVNRFPGYSTLAKRDTPSWNEATRTVIDKRLNDPPPRRFFTAEEWPILVAICDRIIPQQADRNPRVPIANFIDRKMAENETDGMQTAGLPDMQEMWRRGLRAADAEARLRFNNPFTELPGGRQDDVLGMIQRGEVRAPGWSDVPPKEWFKSRVLHDITTMYYAHPRGWDEMGFGGPASPRGYVRMGFNRHDPWDPVERKHA